MDIPPELGPVARFRVSLGHKANHSFRFNAQYSLFSVHPVLGTIMAVVATRDLPAGAEVLCKYGYPGQVYKELNITASDQQCFKVTPDTRQTIVDDITSEYCREYVTMSEMHSSLLSLTVKFPSHSILV